MKQGIFIAVEGGDGAGKSTQLRFLKEYFERRGEQAIFTREPGGTPIGEKIRSVILDRKNEEMAPMTEMLLYAASRAQHVQQVIKPALEHGKIVICDRFIDSSIAYQGYARKLGDAVLAVNQYAICGCMPDRTFLLKLDPEEGARRLQGQKPDRLEQEGLEFQRKVYEGYLQLEKEFPDRIIGIDAGLPEEQVSEAIGRHLDDLMEGRHDVSGA